MQGQPTDETVVAAFRAAYLYSGNASKSARDVNIPVSTGRDIAARLSKDPEFASLRREIRAQALDELVAMRQRMAETAAERFEDADGGIDVKRFGGQKDATVVITDKRADYGKLLIDAEKNAQNLARLDAERLGEIAPQREIVLKFEPIK